MVEAGGIGKGGRATAAEAMDSTDSEGNGDQAAAANCGGGDRRRAAAVADIYMSERMDGPQRHNGQQNLVGQLLLSNFGLRRVLFQKVK